MKQHQRRRSASPDVIVASCGSRSQAAELDSVAAMASAKRLLSDPRDSANGQLPARRLVVEALRGQRTNSDRLDCGVAAL